MMSSALLVETVRMGVRANVLRGSAGGVMHLLDGAWAWASSTVTCVGLVIGLLHVWI